MVDRKLNDFPSSTSLFYTRSKGSYLDRWANPHGPIVFFKGGKAKTPYSE